jgi:hypothetical protein
MDWVNWVRIPAWKMFSSLFKNIQTGSEVQKEYCSRDTGVLPQG